MKEIDLKLTPKTTFEELLSVISLHTKFEAISEKNHRLLFEEMLEKVQREEKKREKDMERKRKKEVSRYLDLLESISKKISITSTYAEASKGALADHSAFKEFGDEEVKERLFNEWMEKRKEDTSDEEGRIRSESPEDKNDKRRDKKHHTSSKHHKSSKKEKKHHKHKRHHSDSESEEDKRSSKKKKSPSQQDHTATEEKEPTVNPPKLTEYSSSEEEGETKE